MTYYVLVISGVIKTNLNENSLIENISIIISNYDSLSQSDVKNFKEKLNCKMYFEKIFKKQTTI